MTLATLRAELIERNVDNVARTQSYLELYAWTREHGVELPWLFMAHLVSRNAGYLMTDLARRIAAMRGAEGHDNDPTMTGAMENLFVLLERANFLIFWDAWHHVGAVLAGELDTLASPRTPRFMIDAWQRHHTAPDERTLVLDLVHNEQHLIEHRAVHHPELGAGLRLMFLIEASGKDRPLVFPAADAPDIRARRFAEVDQRIAVGRRIFDEVLADRARRDAMFAWAMAHPHTGSRGIYGGPDGPGVRDVWPVERVRAMWHDIHADPAPDPRYC